MSDTVPSITAIPVVCFPAACALLSSPSVSATGSVAERANVAQIACRTDSVHAEADAAAPRVQLQMHRTRDCGYWPRVLREPSPFQKHHLQAPTHKLLARRVLNSMNSGGIEGDDSPFMVAVQQQEKAVVRGAKPMLHIAQPLPQHVKHHEMSAHFCNQPTAMSSICIVAHSNERCMHSGSLLGRLDHSGATQHNRDLVCRLSAQCMAHAGYSEAGAHWALQVRPLLAVCVSLLLRPHQQAFTSAQLPSQ